MIQRIQSLFLFAASAILGTLFFSVMAQSSLESVKFINIAPLLILNIITTLVSFVSIFLYRHRVIQIRVSIFNSLILVAYQAWIIYLFIIRPEGTAFTVNSVFPIVAAIITWLAIRYIGRDEAMVRSVNRLRK